MPLYHALLHRQAATSGAMPVSNATSSTSGATAGAAAPVGMPSPQDLITLKFLGLILQVWLGLFCLVLTYRLVKLLIDRVRIFACMNNEKQHMFMLPMKRLAALQKHVIDAPLFHKRHNREFTLSRALNMGVLPTRLQTMVIFGYYALIITLTLILLPWSADRATFFKAARNRAGVLSVFNMIPLFLFAGRTNPLLWILDLSFDTFNMLHRWLGRLVVIEAVLHTAFHMVQAVEARGWAATLKTISTSSTILTGTIGTAFMLFLLLHSSSAIRHAYYETFLHAHILVVVGVLVATWYHLDDTPTIKPILLGAMIGWGIERTLRFISLLRNNVGAGGTSITVEPMTGDAMRITLHLARPWKFRPGQHIYLYVPSIGWWTNHPFSLAWSDDATSPDHPDSLYSPASTTSALKSDMEKHPSTTVTVSALPSRCSSKSTMSLIIRRRTSFTDALWKRCASLAPDQPLRLPAYIEGPYGSQSLSSYGTVVLFAAGVGITHQVPFVRDLITRASLGSSATRRLTLVWIIQSPEHLEWIRPWMTDVFALDGCREVLRVQIFVSRPRTTREIHSTSSAIQMFPGKPDVGTVLAKQVAQQVGAMAVSVCGTGSLADDVRRAVRERQGVSTIDLFENSFSW